MKPINHTPPEPDENEEITEETKTEAVSTNKIAWILQEMKKNKSPGITAIPINYYYWGAKPMHEILHRWYSQLRYYKYVPWNLKLDIKVPFPKYETDAHKTTKQDPAKYRPIALQNSMYKILDGCIKSSLERHDKQHQIIHDNQGGFKQREGTIENLHTPEHLPMQSRHQLRLPGPRKSIRLSLKRSTTKKAKKNT